MCRSALKLVAFFIIFTLQTQNLVFLKDSDIWLCLCLFRVTYRHLSLLLWLISFPDQLLRLFPFCFLSGSWVCRRADVRAELFGNGVADLSVPQPVCSQPRQPLCELLWPGGEKERSPARRWPAYRQPRPHTPKPPAGAQRPPHTEQGPPGTHNQVRCSRNAQIWEH